MLNDDCRCEKCENKELFRLALKRHLRIDLAETVSTDPTTFIKDFVSTTESSDFRMCYQLQLSPMRQYMKRTLHLPAIIN